MNLLSIPQPLDRNFFRLLKAYYDDSYDNWTRSHLGQVVTQDYSSRPVKKQLS